EDRTTRRGQLANWPQRRLLGEPPASERDHHNRQGHNAENRSESGKDVFSSFGTLPDLDERSIQKPDRRSFQLASIPVAPVTEHDGFRSHSDHPHEQRFRGGSLFGLHSGGKRTTAAA